MKQRKSYPVAKAEQLHGKNINHKNNDLTIQSLPFIDESKFLFKCIITIYSNCSRI